MTSEQLVMKVDSHQLLFDPNCRVFMNVYLPGLCRPVPYCLDDRLGYFQRQQEGSTASVS
jgi:hypothetical protein